MSIVVSSSSSLSEGSCGNLNEANLLQNSISLRAVSLDISRGGKGTTLFFLSVSFCILFGYSRISAIVSATKSIDVRPRMRQFYASSESNILSACVKLSNVEMLAALYSVENDVDWSFTESFESTNLSWDCEMLALRHVSSVSIWLYCTLNS